MMNPYGLAGPQLTRPQLPENFDPNWYLSNPELPESLKSVLSSDEEALTDYALRAHKSCRRLEENGLLDFFEKDVMSLIRTKPKVCDAFRAKDTTRTQQFYGLNPSESKDQSNPYGHVTNLEVQYTNYQFNPELINLDELTPYEKLLMAGLSESGKRPETPQYFNPMNAALSIPKAYEDQPHLQGFPAESFAYILDRQTESMKKPHPMLTKTMLMRLWDKLSPLEQMKGLRECPSDLSLNDSSITWNINDEDQPNSSESFSHFKKICEAKTTQELLPYLDESVMTEFALHAGGTGDASAIILPLCLSWPEEQVVTPIPLPSVTKDQIFYRSSEFSRSFLNRYKQALGLLNKRENSNLSPEQEQALSDYTANGSYDRINAYEMWGRLGVWYIADEQQSYAYMTEEQFNQFNPRPKREDFQTQEAYEARFAHFLKLRANLLPHLYGTPEERTSALEKIQEKADSSDSMTTGSGVHLSVTSQHLRQALEGLEGFEGVTFGGHQLSGHLFKGLSLREGATFKPGFFMSTSTTQSTALNFLGLHRAQGGWGAGNRTKDRIAAGEEVDLNETVTGYLFVVHNHNGVPIANYSNYSSENEILLHPDAEYRIIKVETLTHEGETYPNAQVIYLEELE